MEKFVNEVSDKSKIDPATILAIIAAIGQLIAGCQPKPTPAKLASGDMESQLVVNMAMRENGHKPHTASGKAIKAAIFASLATADPAAVDTFLSLCQ